jgi:hypothetical protein
MDSATDRDAAADAFEYLADWSVGSSPLYEAVCRIAADTPALLDLAAAVPRERSTANVFLAAVHYRLLQGVEHPLGDYYETVTEDPRDPDADLEAALVDFCQTEADSLRPLLETKRTQTNSVRRSAALYPAIARVAQAVDGPLALVELGPSAGLNLLLDRYRYDYGDRTAGPPDSPVTIESDLRGEADPPMPETPPAIHSRVGIDLHPLSVTDAETRDWLRALVWPDQPQRHRVLDDALALARDDPPELLAGDMAAELPAVLDSIPDEVPVCVFDTLVLYQVPESVRAAVTETIETAAASRPLHWIAGEDELGHREGIRLEWTRSEGGEVQTDLLGGFRQHGEWVRWDGV